MQIPEASGKCGKKSANPLAFIILSVLLLVLISLSFLLGRFGLSPGAVFEGIRSILREGIHTDTDIVQAILVNIRFPRIIAAVLVGAALATAGSSYQGIFRNPMVSPDILGASAGAGFGASFGILLGFSAAGIQLVAFIFGLIAVFLSYIISRIVGRGENVTLILVLSGMVVGSLFGAFISIIKYTADPLRQLPEITLWLMGSLATVTNGSLRPVVIPLIIGFSTLILVRWRINVLAFGDEEARALGVNTKLLRGIIIAAATLITTSVISISGQIGWIGLVVPHLTRMLVGPDYRKLLPASIMTGSIFLLLVDNIARNLFKIEIPLGILTAIIGAPFFVYLLVTGKKGWL
jgi:iron complex transport system permease protein